LTDGLTLTDANENTTAAAGRMYASPAGTPHLHHHHQRAVHFQITDGALRHTICFIKETASRDYKKQ